MKPKPNTDQFKIKKDPTLFLEGGDSESINNTNKNQQPPIITSNEPPLSQMIIESKIHKEQKVFRLPLDLINLLKRESYERSVKTGSRVTETELVELALRSFLKL